MKKYILLGLLVVLGERLTAQEDQSDLAPSIAQTGAAQATQDSVPEQPVTPLPPVQTPDATPIQPVSDQQTPEVGFSPDIQPTGPEAEDQQQAIPDVEDDMLEEDLIDEEEEPIII